MLQVTFPEIARVLESLSSSVPPAEGHGCLCGALCASMHYPLERWLDEIVPEPEAEGSEEDRQPLRLLFSDTLNALRGDAMALELLLPSDERALVERAVALSQWCQGFLYGFGTGAPPASEVLPQDVNEVLRDLTHIGQATVELEEGSEEEEEAYAEIVEYVRVGVQLIHDELLEVRSAEAPPPEAGDAEIDAEIDADSSPPHADPGSDPTRLN